MDTGAPALPALRVHSLAVYPVKGLRGIRVASRRVDPLGLEGDRRWMVVDAEGTFVSQRSHPGMARVETAFVGGGEAGEAGSSGVEPARIRLAVPDRSAVEIPAEPREGASVRVRIWDDRVDALAPSPEADAWMSDILGAPVRLVYQPRHAVRPTDGAFAPGGRVSFADGYPVLLVTQASLDELNRRLPEPVPMDRFRPNVVVEGVCAPHAEDRWRRIQVGTLRLAGVKRCARCTVTTVDQATGLRGVEPLRTLALYRAGGGKVWFGQNMVPLLPSGPSVEGTPSWIREGEAVVVEEEGHVGP
jgi:uncharacterized protein